MKKILLLCGVLFAYCLSIHAQTLSSPSGYNNEEVTITAGGENNSKAIYTDPVPVIVGATTVVTPNNQGYAGLVGVEFVGLVSSYNPASGKATSFKVKLHNSATGDITAKFTFQCTLVNINDHSFSYNQLITYTVTIKAGSAPTTPTNPTQPPVDHNKIYARLMFKKTVQSANDTDPSTGIFDLSVYFYKNENATGPISVDNLHVFYHNANENAGSTPNTPPGRTSGGGGRTQPTGNYTVHEVIANGTQFSLGQVNVPSGPRRTSGGGGRGSEPPPPVPPTPAQLGYTLDPLGGYIIYY